MEFATTHLYCRAAMGNSFLLSEAHFDAHTHMGNNIRNPPANGFIYSIDI